MLVLFVLCASAYVLGFALLGLRKRRPSLRLSAHTRFLVLVPAHNEGRGIMPTLRSLQHADYPEELLRIAVIADNCSDDTAEVARSCGVEVWIRNDPRNPGKGQALSWAFDKAALAFDLATIIDADTEVDQDFFTAMNTAFAMQLQKGRASVALQGKYLFAEGRRTTSWFKQITIASKAAENAFTYRPRTDLGLANLIQGNGFCISHSALVRIPFQATSVVEDAEYAVTLALSGIPVVYVEDALVVSRMTQGVKDAVPQRVRWAGGVFTLLSRSVPQLLRSAIRQRRWQLAEMALMLALTSRLLLIYTTILSVVMLDLAYPFRYFGIAMSALAVAFFLQSVYLYLIFRRAGSVRISLQTIAFMPLYVGFLGAMQLGALLGLKKRQWSRTIR